MADNNNTINKVDASGVTAERLKQAAHAFGMDIPTDETQISYDPNSPPRTVKFVDCPHPQPTHNTVIKDTWYYCDECRLYRKVEDIT